MTTRHDAAERRPPSAAESLTAALAVLLLLTACTVTLDERRFFHPGPSTKADDASKWQLANGAVASDIILTMADGTKLHAVRVTRPDAVAEVLYFGGQLFRTEEHGQWMAQGLSTTVPANILMLDYRGYGRSGGTPSLSGGKSDALAAYDWLRAQSSLPIVVHGFSLGSFVAGYVVSERNPAGLVLESTATNVRDWVDLTAPSYVRVRIAPSVAAEDNLARVGAYRGPLLLVVGSADKTTPASMSKKLLDASPSSHKELVIVPGAGHGDALGGAAVPDAYRRLFAALPR